MSPLPSFLIKIREHLQHMRIGEMSGGMQDMMSQMQQIRQNGGMTREDLENLQAKAEEVGGPGKDHFAKISENFDSIDGDKDGKLSKTEMDEFAEAEGIERPHRGRGGPPPWAIEQLDSSSEDSGEDDDETSNTSESTNSLLKTALEKYSSAYSYSTEYTSSLLDVL